MDWRSLAFDWNQVRAFLVTAEEGSFSAASRALGLTQPTLGRQVAALEDRLGIVLFERVGRSLALTEAGLELLDHVRTMGDAATMVALAASGQAQSVAGHVAITATDSLAVHLLPPALARIRAEAPGITVEVIASNDVQDLRRREADISIRHVRPEQPDLIARYLRDLKMRLYATPGYLDRIGRPGPRDDLTGVDFIGFDRTERFPDRLRQDGLAVGLDPGRSSFPLTSENGAVAWAMVEAGLGIGIMAEEVARGMANLELAFPDLDPILIPIWLVTHREVRTNRRIRLVYDILAEVLASPRPIASGRQASPRRRST